MIRRKEWLDICIQSSFMTAAAIAVFVWALADSDEQSVAQTMAFATLSVAQTLHVLNYSSVLKVILGRSKQVNRPLIGAIVLAVGLLIVAIYVQPLSDVFELHPLNMNEWAIVLAASAVSFIAMNATMFLFKRS